MARTRRSKFRSDLNRTCDT